MVILLRSGWQSINIGDISHTAGFLLMAKEYLPQAEIIPWVSDDFPREEEEMFRRHFPQVQIVKGRIRPDGTGDNQALTDAVRRSELLIHNSGPMLVAKEDVEDYINYTGKPYGVWGITYDGNDYYTQVLSRAAFVYFRDSVSLAKARETLSCPVMDFGPDVAFFVNIIDEARSKAYLEANDLRDGEFMCCIPRLRYTPFWTVKEYPFMPERHAYNEAMKHHDHQWLLRTIIEVTNRGKKVLLCPEDKTHIPLCRELLYDQLPEAVRAKTVLKTDFWLTDEAVGIYQHSAGLFGNEMHSPIMCVGNGIPAVVCRWQEQTSKGFMWQDIGLGQWLFDVDDENRMEALSDTVLAMLDDPAGAYEKTRKAMAFVREKTGQMVKTLIEISGGAEK